MKTIKSITLLLIALSIYSCSYDSESDLIDTPDEQEQQQEDPNILITYDDDIRPIMQGSCVSCHGNPPTNGAPFSLVNFSQVSQRANLILSAMDRQSGSPGAMPPSGRLPQATIELVRQWIEDGTPEN